MNTLQIGLSSMVALMVTGQTTSGADAQVNTKRPRLTQAGSGLPSGVLTQATTTQLGYSPANVDLPILNTPLIKGLPPTLMDSFVSQAGGQADQIYGDEGVNDIPPLYGFTTTSRINQGIAGDRDKGLTTNHGSYLPDAWGADEILAPPNGEWSQSGTNGGNRQTNNGAAALNTADQQEATDLANSLNGQNSSSGNVPGMINVDGTELTPAQAATCPGQGYEPATTCEGFVGWYSPAEVQLSATNFPLAFQDFVYSGRYQGSWINAMYILEDEMGLPQPPGSQPGGSSGQGSGL